MAKKSSLLRTSSKAIDPTLNALFSASTGPVVAAPKSRYSAVSETKPSKKSKKVQVEEEDDEGDDEVLSEISEELDYGDEDEADDAQPDGDEETPEEAVDEAPVKKERKRKRKDEHDDLEDKYLSKLADEEEEKPVKRQRPEKTESDEESEEELPKHESLTKDDKQSELDKASRTVFLANVASEAISSKSDKKTLLKHLGSLLEDGEKVESIRFRSVAFSTGSMPKRAAYITKSLMDATTKSANAYAVYSSAAAARKAAKDLNGTEVLGRHIRVDSVAHPTPTDHRRCIFVGNLGFMDDETVVRTEDGETVEKKRHKIPSDIEEGLWRTFGRQGRVENVRVVRDPKTRVGKGFAYVQFYDGNTVESALLLDGKKFPPMLPRILRVTRAKDPRKTALAQERATAKLTGARDAAKATKYTRKITSEEQTQVGRAGKLLGRAGAAAERRELSGNPDRRFTSQGNTSGGSEMKTPEQIVFEGKRVTRRDALPKDLKFGKKGKKGKVVKNRSARRAADWKKKS